MNTLTRVFARRTAVLLTLLTCTGLAHAEILISQVYGGGGNTGATYRRDFIELRNTGTEPVSLAGWSVQYASATGSTWQTTDLAGSIPAGGYFLIAQAQGSGGTTDLPTPDVSGSIAMAGTAGKVALVSHQTALSGACPLGSSVRDFVGFGSNANCSETAPAPAPSNSTAILRKDNGATDTGNNSTDFIAGAPNPRNSGSAPPDPPDPPISLTIAQIQGNAAVSPHAGKRVVTEGVVTARKFNNGFFLQSLVPDTDPATSEGIFVFTQAAPPVDASVGNVVRVTGTVTEFTPSSNPNQLSITELTEVAVELLSTGQTLPAPVELTAVDVNSQASPTTLERLEGMRVSVATARVVQASNDNIDEDDALSFTDGVFYVILPGVARPFREPGIGVMDVIPIPAGKSPPRFDTNQERLMVRSRGQIGATALTVDVDADISGLVGVLDYHSGAWTFTPDAGSSIGVAGGKQPSAVSDAGSSEVTIGGFNLLRLFDEINDSNGGPAIKPAALDKRLTKTSTAICAWLKAPDILGVVEVENLRVLTMLADRINSTCPKAPAYVPYLVPGNDVGGINVGFLVSTRATGANPRVQVLGVQQYGKEATLANPDGSTSLLNDRPPLVLNAVVHEASGGQYPVTVIVNHLRSLNDIDSIESGSNGWATTGERVRAKRVAQASYLAGLVNTLQQADANARIVLTGDFNAFEFNDGYADVMGIVLGRPAFETDVLTWAPSPLVTPLVDGSQLVGEPAERYSYVFEGNAQTLDHVLVNEALILDAAKARVEHARLNADFGVHHFGDAGVPMRVSDHDPVRLSIDVPQFHNADLAIAASVDPDSATVGQVLSYTASVHNAGANDARAVGVALVFDALVNPVVADTAGWTCAFPEQDTTQRITTVSCSTADLSAGGRAAFTAQVTADAALAGRSLRMAAAVSSTVRDPLPGNNQAQASAAIQGTSQQSDLATFIIGPPALRLGGTETVEVVAINLGDAPAQAPQLDLHLSAKPRDVTVTAPDGWACTRTLRLPGFGLRCTAPSLTVESSATVTLTVAVPGSPPPAITGFLTVESTVGSATPDPVPGNNRDRYRTINFVQP